MQSDNAIISRPLGRTLDDTGREYLTRVHPFRSWSRHRSEAIILGRIEAEEIARSLTVAKVEPA